MQLRRRVLLIAAGLMLQMPLWSLAEDAVYPAEAMADQVLESAPVAADGATGQPDELPAPSVRATGEPGPSPAATDLTSAQTSLWQRIRDGFRLPELASPLVREQEEWFSSRPDYIKRTVARSSRYLYHIVTEVEKRGMPTEIALLPIIESAYNPTAYSRAHASGIWQFIPSTGKHYGLQQNFWYDGRRDVMAATSAALDYLQKLYDMFGSWDLALASYNWGEGAVGRAIAKNQAKGLPGDYQSLTMPNETRYYIPKLQAVKNIIANPAQFGIELAEVPNQPYFVAVTTTKHIDVKLAAKLAEVPVEEFLSLNPGHSRPVIKAVGTSTLLLPADKAADFLSKLDAHDKPLISWEAYTLKAGDKLAQVAARHGIAIAQLMQINGFNDRRAVPAGTTLLLPARAGASQHLPDLPTPQLASVKKPTLAARQGRGTRTVKAAKAGSARQVKVATGGGRKGIRAATAPARKVAAAPAARKTVKASGSRKVILAHESR